MSSFIIGRYPYTGQITLSRSDSPETEIVIHEHEIEDLAEITSHYAMEGQYQED